MKLFLIRILSLRHAHSLPIVTRKMSQRRFSTAFYPSKRPHPRLSSNRHMHYTLYAPKMSTILLDPTPLFASTDLGKRLEIRYDNATLWPQQGPKEMDFGIFPMKEAWKMGCKAVSHSHYIASQAQKATCLLAPKKPNLLPTVQTPQSNKT